MFGSLARALPCELVTFFCTLGTWILSCGLIAIGFLCFYDPFYAANLFGLPLSPLTAGARGFVEALGLRDAALGAITLALHRSRRDALHFIVLAVFFVPLGDAIITYRRARRVVACVPHCAGASCVGILWLLLLIQRQQRPLEKRR
jgi:hypothetical protein